MTTLLTLYALIVLYTFGICCYAEKICRERVSVGAVFFFAVLANIPILNLFLALGTTTFVLISKALEDARFYR